MPGSVPCNNGFVFDPVWQAWITRGPVYPASGSSTITSDKRFTFSCVNFERMQTFSFGRDIRRREAHVQIEHEVVGAVEIVGHHELAQILVLDLGHVVRRSRRSVGLSTTARATHSTCADVGDFGSWSGSSRRRASASCAGVIPSMSPEPALGCGALAFELPPQAANDEGAPPDRDLGITVMARREPSVDTPT